jgi:hypothetical protein
MAKSHKEGANRRWFTQVDRCDRIRDLRLAELARLSNSLHTDGCNSKVQNG